MVKIESFITWTFLNQFRWDLVWVKIYLMCIHSPNLILIGCETAEFWGLDIPGGWLKKWPLGRYKEASFPSDGQGEEFSFLCPKYLPRSKVSQVLSIGQSKNPTIFGFKQRGLWFSENTFKVKFYHILFEISAGLQIRPVFVKLRFWTCRTFEFFLEFLSQI